MVHIGPGKTGSTSIQTKLHTHRDGLLSQGLLYPHTGLSGSAHQEISQALADVHGHARLVPGQPRPAPWPAIRDGLRQEIQQAGLSMALLSYEGFSSLHGIEVSLLLEALRPKTTVVVAAIRTPEDHLRSLWTQSVSVWLPRLACTLRSAHGDGRPNHDTPFAVP